MARRDHKSSEDRHRADGEGAERDRRRERRRREEVDPKREITERSKDKRSHQDPKEKRENVETKVGYLLVLGSLGVKPILNFLFKMCNVFLGVQKP